MKLNELTEKTISLRSSNIPLVSYRGTNVGRGHTEVGEQTDHLISDGVEFGNVADGQQEKLAHLLFHILADTGYLRI